MESVKVYELPKLQSTLRVPYLELVEHVIVSPVPLGLNFEWLFDYFDYGKKD